jgi:serine/threonine protein kinase
MISDMITNLIWPQKFWSYYGAAIANLFDCLALAMKFLRSEGIAHMDLKPQNILLTAPPKQVLKIGGTKIC